MRGNHRGPVNSPHKWSVTRKMFPFDDVIMTRLVLHVALGELKRPAAYQLRELIQNSYIFYFSLRKKSRTHGVSSCLEWRRHHMETFSALPAFVREVRCFDVLFDLRLDERLSEQSRRRRFETPSCSWWRSCNGIRLLYSLLVFVFKVVRETPMRWTYRLL